MQIAYRLWGLQWKIHSLQSATSQSFSHRNCWHSSLIEFDSSSPKVFMSKLMVYTKMKQTRNFYARSANDKKKASSSTKKYGALLGSLSHQSEPWHFVHEKFFMLELQTFFIFTAIFPTRKKTARAGAEDYEFVFFTHDVTKVFFNVT